MTSPVLAPGGFVRLANNLMAQTDISPTDFETAYVRTRQLEDRLYTDDVVKRLPEYNGPPPLADEWIARRASSTKLIRYLKKRKVKNILEIGCGNGWLSALLASTVETPVTGLDVNLTELAQASRVFRSRENLMFVHGNIFTGEFRPASADVIVLAASLQYFDDAPKLLNRLMQLLVGGGEIHILDTPIYNSDSLHAAQQRSADYFSSLHPQMSEFYYHHTRDFLHQYPWKQLSAGAKWPQFLRKLLPARSPFPWIVVMK